MAKQTVIRKANPTASSSHMNTPLTNISVAYIQDTSDFIFNKVFPIVPVKKQSDAYYVFNKNDWFRDEAKRRPPSTETAGGGYRLSDDSYRCDIYGYHKDVDKRVRDNADSVLGTDRNATEFVTQKLLINAEINFVSNYLTAAVWDTDLTGGAQGAGQDFVQLDDYTNSDPISLITAQKRAVKNSTGFMPNGLCIGGEVWDALKDHPDILERIKYTREAIDINPALVARALDIDNLLIAEGIQATNAEGAAEAYSAIVGRVGLLYYAPKRPALEVPSAGYTFAWTGYGGQNAYGVTVSKFWIDTIKSDRIEGEMAYDQKVVATDMGVFFDAMVS